MSLNVGSIADPDLPSLLQQIKDGVMTDLNCHRVGVIQSFNVATQTATITIPQSAQVGANVYQFPLLVDVPVFVMTGGSTGVITMPIAAGDTCLVAFHDRDIDNWFATGNTTTPNTPRVHSLADGMAFVGFRSKANPVANYSPTAVQVRNLGSSVSVAQTIQLISALLGSLTINASLTLAAPTGGNIVVSNTIQVANNVTDLKAVLLLIIAALQQLDSVKDGGSAASEIATAGAAIPTLLT